jgi:phosphomannomutase
VADYVLRNYCACLYQKISVSNLSSSRALKDITEQKGGSYHATAVGEVNVVNKMKEVRAVIGGEGNGGIIYPELHYGRDALVGIALFLSFIADDSEKLSEIKKRYPRYEMIKDKIQLDESINVKELLKKVKEHYQG